MGILKIERKQPNPIQETQKHSCGHKRFYRIGSTRHLIKEYICTEGKKIRQQRAGNEHTRMAKLMLGEGASASASASLLKTQRQREVRRIQKTRRDWKDQKRKKPESYCWLKWLPFVCFSLTGFLLHFRRSKFLEYISFGEEWWTTGQVATATTLQLSSQAGKRTESCFLF